MMKYVYIISWCINFLFATTDTTTERVESKCDQIEGFVSKSEAILRFREIKCDSSKFEGTIFYSNIKLDSIAFDSTFRDERLIKLLK